jgi:integrase
MATIYRRDNGKWTARVRLSGQSISKTFEFKADAVIWANEQEAKLTHHPDFIKKLKDQTTLGDLLRRYQKEVTPSKKGHKQEHDRINMLLKEDIAQKRVYEVVPKDIADIRDRMLGEGKAPSTIKNYINIVSGLYKHAAGEWGFAALVNPVSPIKKPGKKAAREVRLLPHEEDLIYSIPTADVRWTAVFALETSARLLEITSLLKSEVSIVGRVATVHDKVGQHEGVLKRLPLSTRAIKAIEEANKLFPDSKYVFSNDPEVQAQRISTQWKMHRVKWGFRKELWFRDLRHEAISRFFEKGFTVIEVMSITGHTNPAQLTTYTHLLHQKSLASRLD